MEEAIKSLIKTQRLSQTTANKLAKEIIRVFHCQQCGTRHDINIYVRPSDYKDIFRFAFCCLIFCGMMLAFNIYMYYEYLN